MGWGPWRVAAVRAADVQPRGRGQTPFLAERPVVWMSNPEAEGQTPRYSLPWSKTGITLGICEEVAMSTVRMILPWPLLPPLLPARALQAPKHRSFARRYSASGEVGSDLVVADVANELPGPEVTPDVSDEEVEVELPFELDGNKRGWSTLRGLTTCTPLSATTAAARRLRGLRRPDPHVSLSFGQQPVARMCSSCS